MRGPLKLVRAELICFDLAAQTLLLLVLCFNKTLVLCIRIIKSDDSDGVDVIMLVRANWCNTPNCREL